MKASKKAERKLIRHCQGCGQDVPKKDMDEHILKIIRSLRQHG